MSLRFSDHIVWAYAFRPFFLLTAVHGAIQVPVWILVLATGMEPLPWGSAAEWHAAELIFGFMSAAVAGFVLTAAPSWTDTEPITGKWLAGLVLLWLTGRISALGAYWIPLPLVALLNLDFLPVVAFLVWNAMHQRGNFRHQSFIWGILALWGFEIVMYGGWLSDRPDIAQASLHAGLLAILLLIGFATKRVSVVVVNHDLERDGQEPSFRPMPSRRNLATFVLSLYVVATLVAPYHPVGGWVALAAAASQLDVMTDFHVGRCLRRPYVWGLYLAHLWIAIGLTGLGLSAIADIGMEYESLHALAIGAGGNSILTVMGIAGLRHSGRELVFPGSLTTALILINLAAIMRVFWLWLPIASYDLAITASGSFWTAAFALYLAGYGKFLLLPRADGKPG